MLKVIGTPLGNIEDISLRQLRALFETPYIFAEDTRNHLKLKSIILQRYSNLLRLLEINLETNQKVFSYREQNHIGVTTQVLSLLKEGFEVGLVSDAGMPTISDPGQRLIDAVLRQGFDVDVIPSATAIETALAISGLPSDKFSFLGFLPRERGKIQKQITANIENTIIIYESPFRVIKTFEVISEVYPDCLVAACNDLTKKFQKVLRGNISQVITDLKSTKVQGEWVIILNNERNSK